MIEREIGAPLQLRLDVSRARDDLRLGFLARQEELNAAVERVLAEFGPETVREELRTAAQAVFLEEFRKECRRYFRDEGRALVRRELEKGEGILERNKDT